MDNKELSVQHFDRILNDMHDIYVAKNNDYGNSYEDLLNEDGLLVAKIHLKEKLNRFSTLLTKESMVNESIKDTLYDLANDAVLTIKWLDTH